MAVFGWRRGWRGSRAGGWSLAAHVWEKMPAREGEIAAWLEPAGGLAGSDLERAAVAQAWREPLDQDGGVDQRRTQ